MRPNEPVTAGVDIGAGPGAPPPMVPATVGDLLSRLTVDTPELQELFQYLTSGGQ